MSTDLAIREDVEREAKNFEQELISIGEARKMLGISTETWRRHLKLGYYKKLRFWQPGPTARPRVYLKSVMDLMAEQTRSIA